jgi:hypothetical protein
MAPGRPAPSSEPNGVAPAASPNEMTCRTRDRSAASAASPASGADVISIRAPQALSRPATSAGPASCRIRQAAAPAARIALTATAALAASPTSTPAVSASARPRRPSPRAAARTVRAKLGHAVTVPSAASTRAARYPAPSATSRIRSVIARCDVPALMMSGPAAARSPVLTPRSTRTSQPGRTSGRVPAWSLDPPGRRRGLPFPTPPWEPAGGGFRVPPPPCDSGKVNAMARRRCAHGPNCVFRCAYRRAQEPRSCAHMHVMVRQAARAWRPRRQLAYAR